MASIFSIPPNEYGGPTARSGFDYQDRVCVSILIEMANDPTIEFVEFETHDDIVISRTASTGRSAELIQVKSDNLTHWKLRDITSAPEKKETNKLKKKRSKAQKKACLIVKQLSKAQGDEPTIFRLITQAETNKQLSILKECSSKRERSEEDKLIAAVNRATKKTTFSTKNTPEYWIKNVRWEIRGKQHDLDNANIRGLTELIYNQEKRLLTPAQIALLYEKITRMVNLASKNKKSSDLKKCQRRDFSAYISKFCQEASIYLPTSFIDRISQLEKISIARCTERWLAAGVTEEIARSLSIDTTIGSPTADWLEQQQGNFIWATADFGSGKSLGADRLYQRILAKYKNGELHQVPVFIAARDLSTSIFEEIERQTSSLNDKSIKDAFVLLDGVDELGQAKGSELLRSVLAYAKEHEGTKIIAISTLIPNTNIDSNEIPPELESDFIAIINLIIKPRTVSYWDIDYRLHEDLKKPLFSVLYAAHTEVDGAYTKPLSKADLVECLIKNSLSRIQNQIQEVETHLMRLATLAINGNGHPVHENELSLGGSLPALLSTRLIKYHDNKLYFLIRSAELWFGARAILAGHVSIETLLRNPTQLEAWRLSIAISLNKASSKQVYDIISPIAKQQPSFASLIINDALLNWSTPATSIETNAQTIAELIHAAMNAWKTGFSPISNTPEFFPVTKNGELKKTTATVSNNRFNLVWHDEPESLSPADCNMHSVLSGPHIGSTYWSSVVIDHPAWAWRTTHDFIKAPLNKVYESKFLKLSSPLLHHEIAWNAACDLTKKSRLRLDKIALVDLDQIFKRHIYHKDIEMLKLYLTKYVRSKSEDLQAPYPQADLPHLPTGASFSLKRITERIESYHTAALTAYRDAIDSCMPRLSSRFPWYSAWPFDLRGFVYQIEETPLGGFVVEFVTDSLPSGSHGRARFKAGTTSDRETLHSEKWFEAKAHDAAKPAWRYIGSSGSLVNPLEQTPALKLVQSMVKNDIQSIGWQ